LISDVRDRWSLSRARILQPFNHREPNMKSLPRTIFIVTVSALAVSVSGTLAQDWPQWRGANRDGKVSGFQAPKMWPKELTQEWKVSVGDGVATPALVGDKLYVFSRQEGREILRCLEAATGKELWQDKYDARGADGPASSFSGPRSSPTVADGKVVTFGVRGILSCLDAASGKMLWRKDDFSGDTPRFFTSASPLIADNLCIAEVGGDRGGIVAYDLATGTEKWKWTGDGPAYASPVLMTVDGNKLVVAQTASKMVALAMADGKLVWETPFVAERMAYNAATPIVDGQTIIYSGSNRGTAAVRIEKQGDGFAGKELWKNADMAVQFNTPVLRDGYIYGLTGGNDFFCLNAADGKTAWSVPSSPAAAEGGAPPRREAGPDRGPGPGGGRGRGGGGRGGRGYGSVVDAGSVLLALTPASQLVVFQPDPKAYAEVARIKVADSPTHAYPVVSGNRIFIKDQDSVTLWTVE
jgi:outer membrane protein assembly factor BamB